MGNTIMGKHTYTETDTDTLPTCRATPVNYSSSFFEAKVTSTAPPVR